MDFLTSLISVGLLIALAVPGFILKKLKMLPDNAVNVLVTLLLYIAQPFLTFSSFMKKTYESALLTNMLLTALLALVTQLLVLLIAWLTLKPVKDDYSRRVAALCSYMGNCAFMGIPVLQAFFPGNSEPIMYCAVYSSVFNLLGWTVSVFLLTKDKSYVSVKKAVINPPTIALILALPLFFFSVKLPAQIITSVDFLGNMTSPLSMLILGIRIGGLKFKELFSSAAVYAAAFFRLILSPLLALGLMLLLRLCFPLSSTLIKTIFVISAMPTATMIVVFCEKFTGDSSLAVKTMLLSTIFSVITIPILMLLCVFI